LEIKKGENVIKYGEQGDLFYIILKGSVAVEIPNSNIKNW
jgi:CRP-like cAMP-binding protein